MLKITAKGSLLTTLLVMASGTAVAHDPVFGLGPHVLFKGGVEIAPQVHTKKQGDKEQTELGLELTYGITGDWAAGVELPYAYNDDGTNKSDGVADVNLFTKYRFWRNDKLGSQESAAVMAKVITDTGADDKSPPLGSGTTDGILGLTYGYEARKWYRWASVRYRFNDTNDAGIDRGDMIKLDFVGGIRPTPTGYLEPDTVWLLELNGEYGMRSSLNGADLLDTGGTQWFISPGIFWTKRNFAIKAGIQIPIVSNLNGNQEDTDYRAKIVFEWHL